MNCAIYCRKSSKGKNKQAPSLPNQLIECHKIVEKHKLNVVDTFLESQSGWKAGMRGEFDRMVELINAGKIDSIVCWNIDRIGRNGEENGKIRDMQSCGKITIFSATQIYDKDNTILSGVESLMNEESSKKLSEIVKARLKLKAERGVSSGLAVIGYSNTPNRLKGQRIIVPDKKRFDLCRKWWDYMLSGLYTVEQSLDQITKDGLRNRKGKIVSRSKAFDFFRDIFYTGNFVQNGNTYIGTHKPMISMAEWLKVQQILDSKGKKGAGTLDLPNEKTFIGMLKCGECGASVTMERHLKKYKNGNSQTFWYYRCTKKLGPCSQPCLNAKDFNPQIEAYIKSLELNPMFGEWIKKVLKRRNANEFMLEKKQRELNTKRLNDVMTKKENIYAMKIDGLFSEAEYQKRKKEIIMEEQLLRENFIKPQTEYWEKVIDNSISFASSVTNLFDYGDIYTRQMVLRILGSNLTLKDKKVEIEAKKAFVFLKDVQNDVWHKNLILEPKIMPKLPHDVINYRTSIHSCARDWT